MAQRLPVGAEFGSYTIVRHIAGGGMAQIYLAKAQGLAGFEKLLALKVINHEYANEDRFIQMLVDEAKITVGLSHVNIGQVFDLGQVDGIYYIAMEFIDGIDVLELVNGLHAMGEKVPVEAVALIGRQICAGLHYAHTRKDRQGRPQNIVHRDISPQNILVSTAGEVKVVDFGIAKAAGMSTKTQAGVIKGKVHYMAPEQAMGKKADRRCDIFSTGIVLWEMLTSQMVYSGENVRELVDRVRLAKIDPPRSIRPEIPESLERLVMKALARRPEERFQSAHEFQVELTKHLSSSAPDYGASQLSALITKVRAGQQGGPQPEAEKHLSKDDLLQDVHSVIAEGGGVPDEAVDRYRLLVESDQGRSVQVLEDELIIGRAGQLAIPDARVSRRHARIRRQEESYLIEDLGSANGTYVNELRLAAPQVLADKDQIRIGSFRMSFRTPISRPAPPPEPARVPDLISRLVITCGDQRVEHELEQEFPLHYRIRVGTMCLTGVAGRVATRQDSVWLEAMPSRQLVTVNGSEATSSPIRLGHGDTFQVGEFRFEYRREPAG